MKRGIQGRAGGDDPAFALQSERSGVVERIRVVGEIDLSVVDVVDSEMRRAEASDAAEIELDLDRLEFLDASGLRLLLDLNRRSRADGGRLRIRPASSPQVRRMLELTGAGELLPIAPV